MVGKSVWKINEKTNWKKCKELMENKIHNYVTKYKITTKKQEM